MIKLGKTNFKVNKNGFGALPIQRATMKDSIKIIKKVYENGINFFDTARFYTDSEKKLGKALKDVRDNVIVASKAMSNTNEEFWNYLETSLKELNTDYLDLFQFHNLEFVPKPGDDVYDTAIEAKKEGLIKHIGITSHKYTIAIEAIDSGLYETLQFPFSYLTGETELKLVKKCHENNMGFIAMKAMAGGLIRNSKAAYAFMRQFDNVLPI